MRTSNANLLAEIDSLSDIKRCEADDLEVVKYIESLEREVKSITTIGGSKYNYTEQVGDSLISYGFDTYQELSNHIIFEKAARIQLART